MGVPAGQQNVVPYIMVTDGQVLIQFLESTFGAQAGLIVKSTNGKKITHGELKIGESLLYFADGTEEAVNCDEDCSTGEQKYDAELKAKEPSNIHMYVYVDDAAEAVRRAELAGGTSVTPVMEDENGIMGGFVDPFNNLWWVKSPKQ
ncbi:VOC family protein [Paenibacillus sepulcri]|uniref:VOC domain-containing protein n=1 Tax=Paenibacillus sepulcri TaxID=359917 RepID=A0ABS7C1U7_9BACL|nr:hypothetical protein [Paenibacillus sepulcri]